MYQRAPAASPAVHPYGHTAMTTVEGPPAPPPRQMGRNGFKTMFVKRMEGNSSFTMRPSTGPGDARTGDLPGLGRGLQSL